MSSQLKETTKKALTAQTSDQLYKKLQDGKLFGVSKEAGLEILIERKAKGKFEGDLSKFTGVKAEKAEKAPKVAKEKVAKEKGPSKASQKFPNFKLKFKKDQEVSFTPFRETKALNGKVISSYPWQPKKGEVREDVRIRVGDKVYTKKGSEVKLK
jgi:hypothetical protein